MTDRLIWPTPPEEELSEYITELDNESRSIRLDRVKFLYQEFGPSSDLILVGPTPAYFALVDISTTFMNGAFLSTIMAAHIFAEQSLGASLILVGDEQDAEGGLGRIITRALSNRMINENIATRLNELKNIRIAYFHAHAGAKKRSFIGRFLTLKDPDLERVVENDAKEAIRIVVDLIRFQTPETCKELKARESINDGQYQLFGSSNRAE